jgi:hypothetical protein
MARAQQLLEKVVAATEEVEVVVLVWLLRFQEPGALAQEVLL